MLPADRACLYIDMAYSLAELRQRGHSQFFEMRHSGGYFRRVIGLHPLADRVTDLDDAITRKPFSDRQDVIEAKAMALGMPRLLAPLDFLLTQAQLVRKVAKIVQEEKIDLIIATDPLYSGLFGLAVRRLTRVPLVVLVVANYDLNFEGTGTLAMPRLIPTRRMEQRVIRYVLCRADLVAPGSGTLCDYSIENGAPPDRTELFRVGKNMVDAHLTPPDKRPKLTSAERETLGIGNSLKLLLTVARLEKEKLVEDSIRAMSIVISNHPDALLLLAGKGSQRGALETLAHQLGVERNVRFLGLTSQEFLSRLAPDAVILSPLTGMALLETSMAGAPPVAYDLDSSISDLVESGVTGELVEPRDWRRMGEAASAILSDPSLRTRYSKAVRKRAEFLSDRERLFGIEHQAFEKLLERAEAERKR